MMDVVNVIVTSEEDNQIIGLLQRITPVGSDDTQINPKFIKTPVSEPSVKLHNANNFENHLNSYEKSINVIKNTADDKLAVSQPDGKKIKDSSFTNKTVYRVLCPEELCLKQPVPAKPLPAAPKKTTKPLDDDIYNLPLKVFRMRSGRLAKPPAYIQEAGFGVVKDSGIAKEKSAQTEEIEKRLVPPLEQPKRTLSAQFRCLTCNKAYLGKSRMARHLQLNPDHRAPLATKQRPDDGLWANLLQQAQSTAHEQQIHFMCKELANILQRARSLIPPLLKPAADADADCCEIGDVLAAALGVPAGRYIIVDKTPLDQSTVSNDHSSLLSLLDTGQVMFDAAPNEEEVVNVDQLVNERLKNFTEGELEAPSISSAHSLNLDLSLDLF